MNSKASRLIFAFNVIVIFTLIGSLAGLVPIDPIVMTTLFVISVFAWIVSLTGGRSTKHLP